MTAPDERYFTLYDQGVVRDQVILASFREALRASGLHPDTGLPYTEEEIRLGTSEGSRYWALANAIDLYGQGVQARDLWMVQQLRPKTAATAWLRGTIGPQWGVVALSAVGGSGTASAAAPVGTVFVGSTTIGDPAAHTARDQAGNIYQVLVSVTTPTGGSADITLQGVSTGDGTNIASGTTLTWLNGPLGAAPTFDTTGDFTGGTPDETDADYAQRVEDVQRDRPASGNAAQMRAWAEASTVAVETGFVYSCAFHEGSTLVCVTQKRGSTQGPTARIPSSGTLLAARAYLTPPGSPVVPEHWYVLVVAPVSEPSDASLQLGMRRGSTGGWGDLSPWPVYSTAHKYCRIISTADSTHFNVGTDSGSLPNGASSLSGADAPQLMIWNEALSVFEQLDVASVTDLTGDAFAVVLNTAPTTTVAVNARISPYSAQLVQVADAAQAYFDSLGPGEVVDLTSDLRAGRAYRWPEPNVSWPQRAGQGIALYMLDALGDALSDVSLQDITVQTPSLPSDPSVGPSLVTLGQLGVYDVT